MFLAGCKDGSGNRHVKELSDTLYTDTAALMIQNSNPDRALVILDSAVIVGNLDAFTAEMLRAKVLESTLDDKRRDTAIQICKRLLSHDSASVETEAGILNRLILLRVLNNAYHLKRDNERWLQCSIEMASLNRKIGEEVEALRTETEIGLIMTSLGETEEGLAKLDYVISQLDQPGSVDRLDASIVAMKRKINVLQEFGQPAEIVPLAHRILSSLNHFEQHQQDYADDSFRLPNIPEDRQRYINFYRAQAYGFLAGATTADTARHYLELFNQTDYARTFSGRRMIAPAQIALGLYDEALTTYDEIERRMGSDTLNYDYATILHARAIAASHAADYASQRKALDYEMRYAALSKALSDSLLAGKAHDYAVRYHLQEEQLKAQEAEAASRLKSIIIGVCLLLFTIAVLVSLYYYHQKRVISEKNRVLVRIINGLPPELPNDDQDTAADSSTDEATVVDESLFNDIDAAIRNERLYTQVSLQRQDIIDRFGISRHTLNNLIGSYAKGKSFPQYINTIRLEEAKRLLDNQHDATLATIAEAVGFTPANLREQFKRYYGMTPGEYRKQRENM